MEFITDYNLTGLLLGLCSFLIIGLFHPLVVKGEYYLGVRCWWGFLLLGIAAGVCSVLADGFFVQTLLGVLAFSSFWSILAVSFTLLPLPPRRIGGVWLWGGVSQGL